MNDSPLGSTGAIRQLHFSRHPEPLTRFVKIMLFVSLGSALISLWSDWLQLELLAGQYTEAEGEANDSRQQKIGLFNLAVVIVTAIAFLKWIYRANLNSRGFGARYGIHSRLGHLMLFRPDFEPVQTVSGDERDLAGQR